MANAAESQPLNWKVEILKLPFWYGGKKGKKSRKNSQNTYEILSNTTIPLSLCAPVSFQKRLKSLLESFLSFLCLSKISIVEEGRGVLGRVGIDQTLYNVVQGS